MLVAVVVLAVLAGLLAVLLVLEHRRSRQVRAAARADVDRLTGELSEAGRRGDEARDELRVATESLAATLPGLHEELERLR